MIKQEWQKRITATCQRAGTYRDVFDDIIEQLSQILEIRDNATAEFEQSGNKPVVVHTNKGGHTNIVKNPALVVINECNQQALAYWRELGLTPVGYKKLSGESAEKADTTFEDALARIGV